MSQTDESPLEYNSEQPQLIFAEHGRNIQKMVNYAKHLPTKEERNQAISTIVNIIAQMNPQMKDQTEFLHKVWDHIFIMADYELDVDAPFPPPNREDIDKKPDPLPYSHRRISYKHYGKNIEKMINRAVEMEEGPARDYFINAIASYMKMSYKIWNDEKVSDEIILQNLKEMSGGKIVLDKIHELNRNYDTHLGKMNNKGGKEATKVGGNNKKNKKNQQKKR